MVRPRGLDAPYDFAGVEIRVVEHAEVTRKKPILKRGARADRIVFPSPTSFERERL